MGTSATGISLKEVTEQIKILREFFPNIGKANLDLIDQKLPPKAEGWLAIPRWQNIANSYSKAVKEVLDKIKLSRNGKFHDHCEKKVSYRLYPKQLPDSSAAFERIGKAQEGYDILVVPAQFGDHYKGRSVLEVRARMDKNEFGLGAFAVGIMILTHPERLTNDKDPWIDCPGDRFESVIWFPRFGFFGQAARFGFGWANVCHNDCGSASGFVLC